MCVTQIQGVGKELYQVLPAGLLTLGLALYPFAQLSSDAGVQRGVLGREGSKALIGCLWPQLCLSQEEYEGHSRCSVHGSKERSEEPQRASTPFGPPGRPRRTNSLVILFGRHILYHLSPGRKESPWVIWGKFWSRECWRRVALSIRKT